MRNRQCRMWAIGALIALPTDVSSAPQEVPLAAEMPTEGVTGYSAEVPRPETVIGHLLGTRHTSSSQIAAYFAEVAARSERVVVEQHGRSHEGRPLIHALVTSPRNHARLEAIRLANLRLSDAPLAVSDGEIDGMPIVVLLGYGVHGNEASGPEAAILTLYHLAAGSGPAVDGVLDSVVVIIDPMLNPDGRERFVGWVNRNRGAVATADPQDREHNEPWPGGRTNHYWFDLNRDWLPAQQPESRARLALFHRWRPQLVADVHEMGGDATYFFQPGIQSRTNPNTPSMNQQLTADIAGFHARALDRLGQLYFTEERFDDFYYGKGSTYPDINGAVGILFEQASSRGLEAETANGPLRYAVTVRNQLATSLSTLRAAVATRRRLLSWQREFYAGASEFAASLPVEAYVIGSERGGTRARTLADLLRAHRVRVYTLARDVQVEGGSFRAGRAYVVPLAQPQARLIKAALERVTEFRDSLFYDVSSWTLPLAFDVDVGEVKEASPSLLGEEIPEEDPPGGRVIGGRASYAYLLGWERMHAPRVLARLLRAGAAARVVHKAFGIAIDGDTLSFAAGTVVVPVAQPEVAAETIHELMAQAAAEDGVSVYGVNSGLTPWGPDLGGYSTSALREPRVALITGPGASPSRTGEVWHLLTARMEMVVSLLDSDRVAGADLSRYDVIIMAGGRYRDLSGGSIGEWVRGGGALLLVGDAVEWAVEQELVELSERRFDLDSLTAGAAYGDVDEARGAHAVAGTILEARLDATHPLAYGIGSAVPVFRTFETFFDPPAAGAMVVVSRYGEAPLLSGYMSDGRLATARGAAAALVRPLESGTIVVLMDPPAFRGFWYGSSRLLLNAVLLWTAY